MRTPRTQRNVAGAQSIAPKNLQIVWQDFENIPKGTYLIDLYMYDYRSLK
jgi:hypothetical protein